MNITKLKLIVRTVAFLLLGQIVVILTTDPLQLSADVSIDWSLLWFFTSLTYIVFSFRWWSQTITDMTTGQAKVERGYVDADQIGVLKLFGRPIAQINSGLPFAPLGFVELVKLSIIVQQSEFPAEPENIFRGEMKDVTGIPLGKKPPVRLTFRSKVTQKEAEKLFRNEPTVSDLNGADITFLADTPEDGLGKRVTAEVVPVVRWKITDGIAFVQNIGTFDEAKRQLEDECISVLTRLLTNMSVGQAFQNFRWISAILKKAAIDRTKSHDRTKTWGVTIEGAFLKIINLNHDLNEAIALAAEAEFRGRGERELIEQIGAGKAKAARDLEEGTLVGRTEGLVALAQKLGIRGDEAIAQFVAGQLASGDGTIILGESGITQLAGIAAAFSNRQRSPIITGSN